MVVKGSNINIMCGHGAAMIVSFYKTVIASQLGLCHVHRLLLMCTFYADLGCSIENIRKDGVTSVFHMWQVVALISL